MRKKTNREMKDHWEAMDVRRRDLGYYNVSEFKDVCDVFAPLWLSRYYAGCQERVYRKFLSVVKEYQPWSGLPRLQSVDVLDIGCGAGRWARLLASEGYRVTGIDIQSRLIKQNRIYFPNIDWYCTALQDYSPNIRFGLVSSVTVLQHFPYDLQLDMIDKLWNLLEIDGYAIVLETIQDSASHVFSNTIDGWKKKFEDAGFYILQTQKFCYSLLHRLTRRPFGSWKISVLLDSILEPYLVKYGSSFSSELCGFLLKKQ